MYNVLIIDDEEYISNLIEEILARFGYNVETAVGGREGLRVFEKGLFDLVITDIRMPGVDGHAVAHYIRNSDRSDTPIMAMSGTPWLMKEDEFDSILPKPFSIQALLNAIHTLKTNEKQMNPEAGTS
jgi:DNA-binding response OmpR family regulator